MASVARRTDGRWRARYRDESGREHARHFDRKVDAQRWLDSVTTAVVTGSYVDPKAGQLTVRIWSADWLAAQVHLKPTTRARYANIVERHVLPRWSDVRLADVSHAQVQAWVTGLGQAGLEPATVHKTYRVLSLMMSLAVKDSRLARNPCTGVNLPRVTPRRRRYLNHTQVASLAEATTTRKAGTRASSAEQQAAQSYRLVVLTLAYCGLRWGELAALKVSSLDLLRRRIEVSESVVEVGSALVWGTPKDHERRSVPLPAFLVNQLAAHVIGKDRDDLVFTGVRGRGVLRNQVFRRAGFDRAAMSLGLEGLVPHELRHTAASLAVSAGANVKAVQRMLGHASAAMTLDTYAELFDDDLDAVADRLDVAARTARENPADSVRTNAPHGGVVAHL